MGEDDSSISSSPMSRSVGDSLARYEWRQGKKSGTLLSPESRLQIDAATALTRIPSVIRLTNKMRLFYLGLKDSLSKQKK